MGDGRVRSSRPGRSRSGRRSSTTRRASSASWPPIRTSTRRSGGPGRRCRATRRRCSRPSFGADRRAALREDGPVSERSHGSSGPRACSCAPSISSSRTAGSKGYVASVLVADLRGHGWGVRELELEHRAADHRARSASPLPRASCPTARRSRSPTTRRIRRRSTVERTRRGAGPSGAAGRAAGGRRGRPDGRPGPGARLHGREIEVRDAIAGPRTTAPPSRSPSPAFAWHESDDRAGLSRPRPSPGARRRRADGGLMLDRGIHSARLRYDVPALPCSSSWTSSRASSTSIAASARLRLGNRRQGAGDIADFLILQLCNRAEAAVAASGASRARLHPEASTAGWSAWPARRRPSPAGDRRPPALPILSPRRAGLRLPAADPGASAAARRVSRDRPQGDADPAASCTRAACARPRCRTARCSATSRSCIAVNAPVATESDPQRLARPDQDRAGRGIAGIVRPAVPRHPDPALSPVAPREIPLHRRHDLFRARPHNDYWRRLPQLGRPRFHVTGDWPEAWRWNAGRSGTGADGRQDDPFGLNDRERTQCSARSPAAAAPRPAAAAAPRRPSRRRRRCHAGTPGRGPLVAGGLRHADRWRPLLRCRARRPPIRTRCARSCRGELDRFRADRAHAHGRRRPAGRSATTSCARSSTTSVLNTPWGAHGGWGATASPARSTTTSRRASASSTCSTRRSASRSATRPCWSCCAAVSPWASRAATGWRRAARRSLQRPRGSRASLAELGGAEPSRARRPLAGRRRRRHVPLAQRIPLWVFGTAAARRLVAGLRRLPLRLGGYGDRLGPLVAEPAARSPVASRPAARRPPLPRLARGRARRSTAGLLCRRSSARRPGQRPGGAAARRCPADRAGPVRVRQRPIAAGREPLIGCIGQGWPTDPGRILVIGHTDNVPIRTRPRFPSNWELSKARADAASSALLAQVVARHGPHGRRRPGRYRADRAERHRGRARPNRRVEIVLLKVAEAERHAHPQGLLAVLTARWFWTPGRRRPARAADLVLRGPAGGGRLRPLASDAGGSSPSSHRRAVGPEQSLVACGRGAQRQALVDALAAPAAGPARRAEVAELARRFTGALEQAEQRRLGAAVASAAGSTSCPGT